MPNDRVLVTGASSGIGRELALQFASQGYDLVLVARRQEPMEVLAAEIRTRYGREAQVIVADLSKEEEVQRVFRETESRGLPIEILVNNAGFGEMEHFVDIPTDVLLRMIAVNVSALTHLTRLYLPAMLERRRGRVLNVGSTASFQPGPNVAVYFATKAYVLSLSEALWRELRGTGVTVTCLAPGPTKTEFGQMADMSHTPLFKYAILNATRVAEIGMRATLQGKSLVIPGAVNKLTALSAKVWPRKWVTWATGKLHPLKRSAAR